jgi:hypothetical protein
MRWARRVTHMEEKKNTYKVLVRKTERKRQLGRLRRRWENTKNCLTKVGQRMRTGSCEHDNQLSVSIK